MNLQDSVILVIGGAHRVGKSIGLALATEKAQITFMFNSSTEAATKTTAIQDKPFLDITLEDSDATTAINTLRPCF